MSAIEPLVQAIIDATKEILLSQGLPVTNDPPAAVPAGSTHGRVISLLTYQNSIGGSFCFKCSLEFAEVLCRKMLGQEGAATEMLLDTVAELLNWISGAIKRHYEQGRQIIISTPMVYLADEEGGGEGDAADLVTCIRFHNEGHLFTFEFMDM